MTFSRDGRTLAAGYGGGVVLWGLDWRLPVKEGAVKSVAFSPDGQTLAAGYGYEGGGGVVLWDAAARRRPVVGPLPVTEGAVRSVAFSPDSRTIAAGYDVGALGGVVLWDAVARHRLDDKPLDLRDHVGSVAFGAGGMTIATGGRSYDVAGVVLWNAGERRRWAEKPIPVEEGAVKCVAVGPDGQTLAAGYDDGHSHGGVVLCHAAGRRRLGDGLLPVKEGAVSSVAFSPDGQTLAAGYTGDRDRYSFGGVVLWDAAARRRLADKPLPVKEGAVSSVAFSPDGRTLAAGYDGGVALLDGDLGSWQRRAGQIANRNFTQKEWLEYFPETPYRAIFPDLPVLADLTPNSSTQIKTDNQQRAWVTARNRTEAIKRFLNALAQADPVNIPVDDRLALVRLLDDATAELKEGVGLGQKLEIKAEAKLRDDMSASFDLREVVEARTEFRHAISARSALQEEAQAEVELREAIGRAYEYLGASIKAEPHYARAWKLCWRAAGMPGKNVEMRDRLFWAVAQQGQLPARNRAEAINRILIDDLLENAAVAAWIRQALDPVVTVADRLTVVQRLDQVAAQLKEGVGLGQKPEVEAELREVIGRAYEYLGSPIKAEPHYARAWKLHSRRLGPDDPKTLAMRNRLVRTVAQQGRLPDAERMAQEAYDACMRALGERHAVTAEATNNLGEVRVLLARYDEAVALHRRASRVAEEVLGPADNMTLEMTSDLGVSLVRAGRPAEAVPILQSVVDRRRRVTPRHPDLAIVLGNLGGALVALGRFAEAETVLREAAVMGTQTGGELHYPTLGTRNMLCYAIEGQGRWDEAERGYKTVLAECRALDGWKPPIHDERNLPSPMTQWTLAFLAHDRLVNGRHPPSHLTQRALAFLARLYAKRQRWGEADRLLSELILARHPDPKGYDLRLMSTWKDTHSGIPHGIPRRGKNLIVVADVDHVLHFRIIDGDNQMVVDTDETWLWEQARPIAALRQQLVSLWHHELTESQKSQVIDAVTSIVGHIPPKQGRLTLANRLYAVLTGTADPSAAGPLLAECREALKVPLGRGDWLAAEVASRYGDCLRRQKRFAEAEPILVAAAQEIQKGAGVPPWGLAAARKRVAEL
jgi:tetratricopeptide (TPR) repeat protein